MYKYLNNFYKQKPDGTWLIGVHNNGWTWFRYTNKSVIKNVIKLGEYK